MLRVTWASLLVVVCLYQTILGQISPSQSNFAKTYHLYVLNAQLERLMEEIYVDCPSFFHKPGNFAQLGGLFGKRQLAPADSDTLDLKIKLAQHALDLASKRHIECLKATTTTRPSTTDKDECASRPCQNGATCKDGVNSYSCVCLSGYTGQTCDIDIDECASQPCKNGATCKDGVNSYSCVCPPGYTGQTCDIVPVFKVNFTTLGAEGRLGPSSVGSHYDGQSHEGLVNVTRGMQHFTVPYSGTYRIEVAGAAGGCDTHHSSQGCDLRSKGAYVAGLFQLSAGEMLHIVVGQKGGFNRWYGGSGGGGGSFVAKSTNSPHIVAGGGGGSDHIKTYRPECDGTSSTEGGTAYGTSWTGGRDGNGAPGYDRGCGGAGFYTDGGNSSHNDCTGGKSFLHGGEGGLGVRYRPGSDGGFGGGGGSHGAGGGAGGGGGYSGGAGGRATNDHCAGGGGSFNAGVNATGINGYNTGHGFVTIEYFGYNY